MAAFDYKCLDEKGRTKKGVLEADSAKQIRQQLRDKGWMPLEVTAVANQKKTNILPSFGGHQHISAADLSLVTRQLSTLVQAAIPVEEALKAVARQSEKKNIKGMMLAIRAKVVEGHSFAVALEEYPASFPELYRATVAAGEKSGHLDLVLEQLAEYTESRHDTLRAVKQAMIYPILIFTFSLMIVIALLVFAVPKIVNVFTNSGQELPLLTKMLIASSDFMISWWWLLALIGFALVIGVRQALTKPEIRKSFHVSILRFPVIGKLAKTSDSARLASTLSILTTSGVPLVEALKISGQVTSNLCIRESVREATVRVSEGASLNKALDQCGYFPPMMIQMIASGEASGSLDKMLQRAAQSQDKDLKNFIAAFLGLFSPLTLVFMAGIVFTIVMAMMLPIINMNQLIG